MTSADLQPGQPGGSGTGSTEPWQQAWEGHVGRMFGKAWDCPECGATNLHAPSLHTPDVCAKFKAEAERDQLRADLEVARSEIERLQQELVTDEAIDRVVWRTRCERAQADLAQARARIEKLEAVAKAANGILEVLYWTPQLHPKIAALGVALEALDAAQAAGGDSEP